MKTYSALVPVDGVLRRLTFDAADVKDAARVCRACSAALEGEAPGAAPELPVAYNEKEARRLCGGIGRSTLYEHVALGRLSRVPGIGRLLITRASIELWSSGF